MVNEWDKDEADSLKGRLSATELMNIVQTTKGNGVLTGMDVTEDSPASMNVDIAAGTFIANNVYRSYGGGSQAITAADGSNDRYDILSGKSDGTVTYTAGTAAATPLVPDLPADEILIAVIYVATGVSVINQADICESGLCPVLPVDGDTKMQDALDMNSHQINNVTDPTAAQDAATKNYVDVRLPSGLIVMWHGAIANIPSGWLICDGNNSTPNLLSKFVKGVATAATDPGGTGGSLTHQHTYGGADSAGWSRVDGTLRRTDAQNHEPPYYEVAYLMKS